MLTRLILVSSLVAQTLPPLQFEVASVKPHVEGTSTMRGGFCSGTNSQVTVTSSGAGPGGAPVTQVASVPPGMCTFRRTALREIIAAAYAIPRIDLARLIVGGPDWLDTEPFDIDGKPDRLRTQQELEQMLQTLLADRFALRLHKELRTVDGYALTVAPDGAKLKTAAETVFPPRILTTGNTVMTGLAAPMARLSMVLSVRLGKPVVDQTGMPGRYDFTLNWTPGDDEVSPFAGFPPEVRQRLAAQADPAGPSLFTALREQLGLRLQPSKVPLEFLVIDAVQRPTPN